MTNNPSVDVQNILTYLSMNDIDKNMRTIKVYATSGTNNYIILDTSHITT